MKSHPVRLKPGGDLKAALDHLTHIHRWRAAAIISAVGSLSQAAIRFANRDEISILPGPFEIVALSGTLSGSGSHLHIAVSDRDGKMTGGHLKEGSRIYTTAEIVIVILDDWKFSRELDPESGYLELVIKQLNEDSLQ
jgi:uncharacterized protein